MGGLEGGIYSLFFDTIAKVRLFLFIFKIAERNLDEYFRVFLDFEMMSN